MWVRIKKCEGRTKGEMVEDGTNENKDRHSPVGDRCMTSCTWSSCLSPSSTSRSVHRSVTIDK